MNGFPPPPPCWARWVENFSSTTGKLINNVGVKKSQLLVVFTPWWETPTRSVGLPQNEVFIHRQEVGRAFLDSNLTYNNSNCCQQVLTHWLTNKGGWIPTRTHKSTFYTSTGRRFACWTCMRRITLRFTGNLSHKDLQLDWIICCLTLCITQQMQLCAWFTSLRLTYRSEQWWWRVSSPFWCLDHHKSKDMWVLWWYLCCLEDLSFKKSDAFFGEPPQYLLRHLLIILKQISAVFLSLLSRGVARCWCAVLLFLLAPY